MKSSDPIGTPGKRVLYNTFADTLIVSVALLMIIAGLATYVPVLAANWFNLINDKLNAAGISARK
jgi:hypothetical protein